MRKILDKMFENKSTVFRKYKKIKARERLFGLEKNNDSPKTKRVLAKGLIKSRNCW